MVLLKGMYKRKIEASFGSRIGEQENQVLEAESRFVLTHL